MFQLNFGNEKMRDFSKLNTLLNSASIFGNLAKAVMRSNNKKFLSKVSKILDEDNKVFKKGKNSQICQHECSNTL